VVIVRSSKDIATPITAKSGSTSSTAATPVTRTTSSPAAVAGGNRDARTTTGMTATASTGTSPRTITSTTPVRSTRSIAEAIAAPAPAPRGRYDVSTRTTRSTQRQAATKRPEKEPAPPASRSGGSATAVTAEANAKNAAEVRASGDTGTSRSIARTVRPERTTAVAGLDRATKEAARTGAVEAPTRTAQTDRSVKTESRSGAQRSTKPVAKAQSQSTSPAATVKDKATASAIPGRQRDASRQIVPRQQAAGSAVVSDAQAGEVSGEGAGQVTINGDNNTIIYGDVYADDSIVNVGGGHYPVPYRVAPRFTLLHHSRFHRYWWSWSWGTYHYYVLDNPWDSCGWIVSVPWRGYWGVTVFHPSYHRRYLFVSIGGYWPTWYRYRRYYWYECHPYRWYGTYVYERPVVEEIHNHYYYQTPAETTVSTEATVDDFSDVRMKMQLEKLQAEVERLKQASDLPDEETATDVNFDQAVQAFLAQDYDEAVIRFRVAMLLAPEDMILPFAYSQVLFAKGEYAAAAGTLRAALNQLPQDEDKRTVFYPRGLYEDEAVLNAQVDALLAALVNDPTNPDLNLLYAYHMLGLGRIENVPNPLAIAAVDPANQIAVGVLRELLEKVKADREALDSGDIAEPVGNNASSHVVVPAGTRAAPLPADAETVPVKVPGSGPMATDLCMPIIHGGRGGFGSVALGCVGRAG